LLGGDERAAPVQFDTAALDDERLVVAFCMEQFFAEQLGGGLRNLGVFAPVIILRPGIEMEMDDGGFVLPLHKDRSRVARPAAIVGCVTNRILRRSTPTCLNTRRATPRPAYAG